MIKANYKQSIFDIAIKTYGSLNNTREIVKANNIDFDTVLTTGQNLNTIDVVPTSDENLTIKFMENINTNNDY